MRRVQETCGAVVVVTDWIHQEVMSTEKRKEKTTKVAGGDREGEPS